MYSERDLASLLELAAIKRAKPNEPLFVTDGKSGVHIIRGTPDDLDAAASDMARLITHRRDLKP